MCGFAGIVSWDSRYPVDRATLARLSAAVAHRGPDGEGVFLSHDGGPTDARPQVGLVHRRLAILDPDPRANQPFSDHRGRQLVFNGEVYNFRELRKELAHLRPQYAWRTDCDTEVILVAYDAWGERCVEHFNGMFAIAIWDEPAQRLFLARDRMGQKPLYYGYRRDRENQPYRAVCFASDVRALRAVPWLDLAVRMDQVVEYLRCGYCPESVYGHVGQVFPSEFEVHGPRDIPSGSSRHGYADDLWTPRPPVPDDDAVRRTRELTVQAVRRQLVSDVPLGCFLSGGIDSSVVAASMRAALGRDAPVLTFSIGFDDPRYDESAYAARVARHLGTRHHAFHVRPDAAADLPRIAAAVGEPFADSSALPTYYLARETRNHVKVALSGDGGDELFGGYDRYRAMRLHARVRAVTTPLPWMLAAPLIDLLPAPHPKSRRTRAKRFLQTLGLDPAAAYGSVMHLFDHRLLGRLTGQPVPPTWAGDYQFELARNGRDAVQAALAADRRTYLPHDLLTKVDRASMAFALEVRSPFMDHELVRFAAGLTTPQLIGRGSKTMLRLAFRDDLPPEVFDRPKMGFAVPIGDWFRSSLRGLLRDTLLARDNFMWSHGFHRPTVERLIDEHERGVDHSQRLYALLMLELWWNTIR